jgi:hypothetical protein
MILLVHTCSEQGDVPVALHGVAEEDVTEDAPGCSAEYQDKEDMAGPYDRTVQREETDVLEYERGFDKVTCKVVNDGLGQYKL